MNYRLIAFDMDGTLLQSNKKLSNNVIQAIHKASSKGKEIVISTGRCIPELSEIFEHLPEIRYFIVCNGSLVYDNKTKQVIYSNPINESLVGQMIDIAKNRNVMAQLLDYKCVLEKEKVDICEQYGMKAFKDSYYEIGTLVDDLSQYFQENRSPIQKMNFYHLTLEDKELTIQQLKKFEITIKPGSDTYIECTALDVNKGYSFIKLCEYLQIKPQESIAVGDGFNDLDMLKEAGLSISMKNANQQIQEMCDAVVSDNDHDGCVEAIENYLLKEK